MTARLLDDATLGVLTVVIARGETLTVRDTQRLRDHITALGEKHAAEIAAMRGLSQADLLGLAEFRLDQP